MPRSSRPQRPKRERHEPARSHGCTRSTAATMIYATSTSTASATPGRRQLGPPGPRSSPAASPPPELREVGRRCPNEYTGKAMGRLAGKIALITGGTSGIGLATARQFVDEGAYVFITGRRDRELGAAVQQIGKNVTGIQGDVSHLGDLDRLYAQITRDKGRLDSVFANAGIAKYAPLGLITEEFYESLFRINVKGVLFTVQKALPLLPDGASIILNASIVASKGFATNSVYSAT